MEMTKQDTKPNPNARPAEDHDKLTKRLLSDVKEYYETFNKPCPLRAISMKYSKAYRGDFYDVLDELESNGKITTTMLEGSAAKVIYPGKKKK